MKTQFSFVFFILFLLTGFFTTKAQTLESKYGLDSAKTIVNVSLYTEMVKQQNYKEALPGWRYVFHNAPRFQKSTYKNGVEIMRYMFLSTKNSKYIDTLMMVYDQRIKYFGNDRKYGKGWILGRKGGDLFRFKNNDLPAVKEAYNIMMKSIDLQGKNAEAAVMDKTMEAGRILVEKNELAKEEMINNYLKFMEITNFQIKTYPKKAENTSAAQLNIENNFFASGVADCKTLSSIFTPKFESDPNNMELLNKILVLLNKQECEDGVLYAKVAEKKYQIEPNADAAHNLAKMFIKKKNFAKTKEYLKKSISLEQSAETKAELYYKLANIELSQNMLEAARSSSLNAINNRPDWGKPYIIIGKAYAAYSKSYGEKPFDHQAVYWVAVDKFMKAKKLDPECAGEAAELIKTYSQYFPKKEDAFFEGFKEGDTYKIGDWINETTKVRVTD